MLQDALAVAVGKCNHRQVCARCCLRMRLCYKDTHCPLCKLEQTEVRPLRIALVFASCTASFSACPASTWLCMWVLCGMLYPTLQHTL